MPPKSITFHAANGPSRLTFRRPTLRRGTFACRVEAVTDDGDSLATELDMIRPYAAMMADFFRAIPEALDLDKIVTTESEFSEVRLLVRPGDPATLEAIFWWSDLHDEQRVEISIAPTELRRAASEMPDFFRE